MYFYFPTFLELFWYDTTSRRSKRHPATPNFLQLYKILSTFSILKPPTCGNCSIVKQDAPRTTLISLSDIKTIYTDPNKKVRIQESIKTRLQSLIEYEEWDFNAVVEHDYALSEVIDCLIYYSAGIVTKRILQLSKCEVCKNAFTTAAYQTKPISLFFETTDDSLVPSPNKKL